MYPLTSPQSVGFLICFVQRLVTAIFLTLRTVILHTCLEQAMVAAGLGVLPRLLVLSYGLPRRADLSAIISNKFFARPDLPVVCTRSESGLLVLPLCSVWLGSRDVPLTAWVYQSRGPCRSDGSATIHVSICILALILCLAASRYESADLIHD